LAAAALLTSTVLKSNSKSAVLPNFFIFPICETYTHTFK
jgi:hypothetical protein